MPAPILATKLFIPPPRLKSVLRPRLIEKLNEGLGAEGELGRRLILVSAPAGFGKTSLLAEWAADSGLKVAWLSLDEGDSDPTRFLSYLVAATKTVAEVGHELFGLLNSPEPVPPASILVALLEEVAEATEDFVLVLDDYHLVKDEAVDQALAL